MLLSSQSMPPSVGEAERALRRRHSDDGRIKNSPANVQAENVQALLNQAEIFLTLAKILCRTFRDIEESGRPRTDIKIQAVKFPEHMRSKEAALGAQPSYTITIVWDEI